MNRQSVEPILILGGGPVGLVAALLFARAGFAVTLLDARPLADLQGDRRLLALSLGSCLLLEELLGEAPNPRSEIRHVHVCSAGEPGHVQLRDTDFGGRALGATVWFADLVAQLAEAAQGHTLISQQRPCRWLDVDTRAADRASVMLADQQTLHGPLVVIAEGTPKQLPTPEQSGLLADVLVPSLGQGVALERFTREGPLALLPMPARADLAPAPAGTAWMSMVWCMPSALVSARAGLSETQRCDAIGEALGPRWGRPQAVGSAAVFPLFTHRVDRVCEGQSVRIGNAAQTLHPVAGQGFNLGLRDAATLVDCVVAARRSALANNRPIDWPLALEAYQRRRRNDRWLLPKLTSALPGIFAHRSVFASAARSVGLLGLDLLPPARRGLGRLLMLGGE